MSNSVRMAARTARDGAESNPIVNDANRSARRKSARKLVTFNVEDDEDEDLANNIWDAAGEEADSSRSDEGEDAEEGANEVPETPSKRKRGRPRKSGQSTSLVVGRPRGPRIGQKNGTKSDIDGDEDVDMQDTDDHVDAGPSVEATPVKRKRGRPPKPKETLDTRPESPSGQNLPPHELYFWSNRPGASKKTSDNILPPNTLLDHERFFLTREKWQDDHVDQRAFLIDLHRSAFPQWAFELENDFSVCLYGYGSKRELLLGFAEYIHDSISPSPTIVVVNGLSASPASIVDILLTIAGTLIPKSVKLPTTASLLLPLVLDALDSARSMKRVNDGSSKRGGFIPATLPIQLLISSLDAPSLRKPATQSAIATLAAHENIRLTASVDNPDAPLLWDVGIRGKFRFVHHDTTTFAPWDNDYNRHTEQGRSNDDETAPDVAIGDSGLDPVEMVNALLGRSGRRLGGRDGVGYVLRSLPENARHLFRILVAEQIASSAEDADEDGEGGDEQGLQLRVLYHKAREELVVSTEHQLRTLLKEFFDHQMVESRRDAMGTERLVVPFRKEELEALLEDLVE